MAQQVFTNNASAEAASYLKNSDDSDRLFSKLRLIRRGDKNHECNGG